MIGGMKMIRDISQLTLAEKIGQMIIAGFPTAQTDDLALNYAISELKIGNVILFTHNIGDVQSLTHLTTHIQKSCIKQFGIPAFITIDQEGGMVTRIKEGITFLPGAMATGAAGESEFAYQIGKISGKELKLLGININLAPVLDVNSNPLNPVIGIRSYSDDPRKVSEYAVKFTQGLQEEGVIATGKHFPGHGDTYQDSHKDLPRVEKTREELEQIEMLPFREAIKCGIDAIMTAHIIFPALEKEEIPCTISPEILTRLLREDMGFQGLIITDCMEMNAIKGHYGTVEGVVRAVAAGADLIHISHTLDYQIRAVKAIKRAVEIGEIKESIIDRAVERILKMKQKYNLFEHHLPHTEQLTQTLLQTNQRIAKTISEKSMTCLKDDRQLIPLRKEKKYIFISPKPVIWVGVEDHIQENSIWCKELGDYFHSEYLIYTLNPTDEEIDMLAKACGGEVTVVIATYNAKMNEGQVRLVKRLYSQNQDMITISLRNPYDYALYEEVPCHVCTYEYTPASIESIKNILEGRLKAEGALPIKLPCVLGANPGRKDNQDDKLHAKN